MGLGNHCSILTELRAHASDRSDFQSSDRNKNIPSPNHVYYDTV